MSVRIVVTGSECTGKTTLAQRIAEQFGAPWVPEAARAYAAARGGALDVSDVEPIAVATRDALASATIGAPPLVIADTDLISTVVYARAYYGECPAWIVQESRAQRGDLYLLCAPDVPWVADGIRDRPSEEERTAMHSAFDATLRALQARVVVVRGVGDARTAMAFSAVSAALDVSAPR